MPGYSLDKLLCTYQVLKLMFAWKYYIYNLLYFKCFIPGTYAMCYIPFSRAVLAFMLLGLLALVTFGPSLLGAFGGGSSNYGYNRNGFDYYE